MNVQDELLAAMYHSFFADEARFDVVQWLRKNDIGQSAFSTGRDKLELDIGPNGRNLVDALHNNSLLEKRVGNEVVILPAGIDHVEANGLIEEAVLEKIRDKRFKIMETTQKLQAASANQDRAQAGRVMNETRFNRHECAPIFKELERRGWVVPPAGQTEGWLSITWEGAQALDAMRANRPEEKAADAPGTSGGAVPLSAIKFFD